MSRPSVKARVDSHGVPNWGDMSQRIDGFLTRKAQEVWGASAQVWVIEPVDNGALGRYRQRYELHRPDDDVQVVVLGWKFSQARGGLQVLMRAARAEARRRAALEGEGAR